MTLGLFRSEPSASKSTASGTATYPSTRDLYWRASESPQAAAWTLVLTRVMTYCYEVFNLNISRDKSKAGVIGANNFARAWLREKTMGMAALTDELFNHAE